MERTGALHQESSRADRELKERVWGFFASVDPNRRAARSPQLKAERIKFEN